MRIISLKATANSANLTLNYACFEKEIQRRLNGRRTRSVLYTLPPQPFPSRLLRVLFHPYICSLPTGVPSVPSDVQPSSMVSSAGAVWLPAQCRKSDVHALPTRSWRWLNHYKAPSPSRTAVTPCKTMVQHSSPLPSTTVQSRPRCQGHSPRPLSLQNAPIKRCLISHRTTRRRLPTLQ